MVRAFLAVGAAASVMSAGLLAQGGPQSIAAARELTRTLTAQQLESVAAADPQTPGRFIAALYIAPSQLLVVGASHPSGAAAAHKIWQRQYRDVYLDLQSGLTTEGKWFVHDLGADGLGGAAGTAIDNIYENGARVALVDGRSRRREAFSRSDQPLRSSAGA